MNQEAELMDWTEIDATRAEALMDKAGDDVRITFLTPPECQGQIVTREYAGLGTLGLLCRTTDRSDRTVVYSVRDWRDDDEETPGLNYEPR